MSSRDATISTSASSTASTASKSPRLKASNPVRTRARLRSCSAVAIELEDRQEGLLRDLDPPDLLHPLLPGLLLLEQLPLAGDVPAVELRRDVLAERLHRLPGEHPRAHRRLDRDVEELAGDRPLKPLDERPAGRVGGVAVDDQRQRVDPVAGEEDVELDEVRVAVAERLVVERGIARGSRLELVVEVEDDLGERQVVA